MYRTLDPVLIVKTLAELESRITARFPGSGLSRVCRELRSIAKDTEARISVIAQPNYVLRAGVLATLVIGMVSLVQVTAIIELKREAENFSGLLQGIDSGFNILLLMGAGILFLTSLETRWKRHQIMDRLHELRSIVHVIDMHQMPKDPSSDRPATVAVDVDGSAQRPISAFELARYLDYCSEMLSLAAKVAALYAQSTKDSLVIAATNDLEQMTANLSSKIWQKITILQTSSQIAGQSGDGFPALAGSATAAPRLTGATS